MTDYFLICPISISFVQRKASRVEAYLVGGLIGLFSLFRHKVLNTMNDVSLLFFFAAAPRAHIYYHGDETRCETSAADGSAPVRMMKKGRNVINLVKTLHFRTALRTPPNLNSSRNYPPTFFPLNLLSLPP